MSGVLYAADTLDMSLREVGDAIFGSDERVVYLGPFPFFSHVSVYSDVVTQRKAGFFISFSKNLWGYLESEHGRTVMHIINGKVAGLSAASIGKFGGVSTEETLTKLHAIKAITRTLRYGDDDRLWREISAPNLDQGPTV